MQINVQENIALKNLCTFKTGGPAMFFAEAKTPQVIFGLREFAKAKNIPYLIIGAGSNILIADEGYPGLIILNKMTKMHIQGEIVTAESGVALSKMVLIAAQHNLGGISGLATIPGTVGGAIYGNAGIPDVLISDSMMHAVILPVSKNKPVIVSPKYFQFGYRDSKIKITKDIVLSATFKLNRDPGIKIRAEVNQYIKQRAVKQPTGFTCGSFFKNPGQFPSAGWLIEQSGCKGMKVGDAEVSQKHANFFMNKGSATTKDILELAIKVHQKVKAKFDINLEPEVQILPISPFNQ